MESPEESPTVWYAFSDDLPDGEVIVPIRNKHGLAFAVRRGAMEQSALDDLNRGMKFVLGVGLLRLGQTENPPDEDKNE